MKKRLTQHWKQLALPQIFIAYPGVKHLEIEEREEHSIIIEAIRDVIKGFSHTLKAVYWEDSSEAGNINMQVIRDISNSELGSCYFSEPAPATEEQFKDNANVLFEAGMMQALVNSPSTRLRAWIPIREKEPTSIPFDIASERILYWLIVQKTISLIKPASPVHLGNE